MTRSPARVAPTNAVVAAHDAWLCPVYVSKAADPRTGVRFIELHDAHGGMLLRLDLRAATLVADWLKLMVDTFDGPRVLTVHDGGAS